MSLVFKTYKVIYRRDTMKGFLEQRDSLLYYDLAS